MRAISMLPLLLPLLLLTACEHAAVAVGAVELTSVALLGRGVVDIGVSAVTGKDCSIVRLDRGLTYCAPAERLPASPPFCTNTLGNVQCWANPEAFAILPHQLADAPSPNAEQVRNINARWPKSLNLGD
jgi:hypothetical protein